MKQISKMHGIGNDILIIDQPTTTLNNNMIKMLGHRKQGIGFDQCIVIHSISDMTVHIDIFNANGQQVYQCGNGLRCLMRYLATHYDKNAIDIVTGRYKYRGKMIDQTPHIYMGVPSFLASDIPTHLDTNGLVTLHLPEKISMGIVFIGNPHAICLSEDQNRKQTAEKIQASPFFPEGINVSFISKNDDHILLETYERGVGKTDACGSAACAAALVQHHFLSGPSTVQVNFEYGSLVVDITPEGVWQSGPATTVFTSKDCIQIAEYCGTNKSI